MKKIFFLLATIIIATNSFTVYANNDDLFPKVGISSMIDDITEDQIKWAYAKELGEREKQFDAEELRLMSAIIWAEAGNQCEAGKQAVGIVVMNRVNHKDFENDVISVIYEPGQFRPKEDGQLSKALSIYDTHLPDYEWERMQLCIDAAKYALSGNKIVIYENEEYDMSEYLYFARDLKDEKVRIQDHDFK